MCSTTLITMVKTTGAPESTMVVEPLKVCSYMKSCKIIICSNMYKVKKARYKTGVADP